MQTSNISEPIFSNSVGWFRYNYDENRLEFLNHNTKLVVQIWDIPADQWEALPSQQEYCENIVIEATQKMQNQAAKLQTSNKQAFIIFIVSAIITAVYWYLSLNDIIKWYNHYDTVIGYIAPSIAVIAFARYVNTKSK